MSDVDAWEVSAAEAAHVLLELAPWDWRRWCEQATLGEIEAVIAGAVQRRAEGASLLAWQTAHVMRAGRLRTLPTYTNLMESLRAFAVDPRVIQRETRDAEAAAAMQEAREAAMVAAGYGVTGQLTREELEQAIREATAE